MASLCLLECAICQQSLTKVIGEHNQPISTDDNDPPISNRDRAKSWIPVCTPCGHLFHKGCISEWFRIRRHFDGGSTLRGTCPTCRKIFAYHKLIRVYLTSCHTSTSTSSTSSCLTSFGVKSSSATTQLCHASNSHGTAWLPRSEIDRNLSRVTNNFRIYSDFINLRHGRDRGNNDRELIGSHWHVWREFLMENNAAYEIRCHNEDCRTLQTVYQILTKEFKNLQQKLELELDVSKMKSLLVTSLQRDLDKLRLDKDNLFSGAAWFAIVLWLICCMYAFMR